MSENPEPGGATRSGSGGVLEKDPRVVDASPPERGEALDPGGRAHRFWSARRVPATLTALVLLGASGLLLYDVVAVRAGHRAMAWRRTLARELAERPLDDIWTLVGAGVAAALGLWLLLLALTPGRRRLLPMGRVHPDVRAVLHRKAAALAVRDRAMEVPGVQSATVKLKRRKAKVRAVAHFRDVDEVRTDLRSASGEAVEDLGLARPPKVSVKVVRPQRKR
ncbi:DUF6286 domain-containing protein [Streptomyces sp. NPDC058374]|uniref:DUF6286 domain-containing protein n=1 Tax=unclassified Streptomyces TaxID=2593676 RepID=UPI003657B389